MQNEFIPQPDCQPLDEEKLVQIEGGSFESSLPVRTLPIRFPRPPIIVPIIDPIRLPIELPVLK